MILRRRKPRLIAAITIIICEGMDWAERGRFNPDVHICIGVRG